MNAAASGGGQLRAVGGHQGAGSAVVVLGEAGVAPGPAAGEVAPRDRADVVPDPGVPHEHLTDRVRVVARVPGPAQEDRAGRSSPVSGLG